MRRLHLAPTRGPFGWLALASVLAHAAAAIAGPPSCRDAAIAEEQAHAIPRHLLGAIASVESAGNPWSVNADGVGRRFATKRQAIEFVRQAWAEGARYVDVGCFQIDLFFHPEAFADLQQAFDPAANAAYAAVFLTSLHDAAGDWGQAIGDYHSRDRQRGGRYRNLVFAVPESGPVGDRRVADGAAGELTRFGMRVVVPGRAARGGALLPRVFTP